MSHFKLTNKLIIVTGASSGIGQACAIMCSKYGAKVIAIGRNQDRLNETLSSLEGTGHGTISMDLNSFDQYPEIITRIVEAHGKIDGVIHSAGVESTIPIQMLSAAKMSDVLKINSFSFFELVKVINKKKLSSPGISFVGIASVMGVTAQKGKTIYCASKAALINGAKAMALELAAKGTRINTVAPAIVETSMVKALFSQMNEASVLEIKKMHPLGFGNTDDVALACVYLLSDASKWVTGSNLVIDGGYTAH